MAAPRLVAPRALLTTPPRYNGTVQIEMLPEFDGDKNRRPWHAKMVAFRADEYSALMIGSSNFTCAGMGVGQYRNAEANLLTVVGREEYGRETGELEGVWPTMEQVADPEAAEWLGVDAHNEEEERAPAFPVPPGFLMATYRAGSERKVILRLDPDQLPAEWQLHATGRDKFELLSDATWRKRGSPSLLEIAWAAAQPPEKLLVRWLDHEAFLPFNVEDAAHLPPPVQLEEMSADDMLGVLAAVDPSAAFRAWANGQQPSDLFDDNLDSATPIDLDPLRRYDLQATFLHRIRRRARILAQLRLNLQRPVWGRQALEWRLRGLIGVQALAARLVRELENVNHAADEALLALADFLIVLREVDYQGSDGAMAKAEFEGVFRPFLRELADGLRQQVESHPVRLSEDLMQFWKSVVKRCHG